MKFIINADDFGYSNGVNYGIIDAHINGILTSTTCLTNMPGFNHAISLAKTHKNLGVGIHLTLTCGKPILNGLYSLVDSDGNCRDLSHYEQKLLIDESELYNQWKAQIEQFSSTGLVPTHLDSHHHVNNLDIIKPIFLKLAAEFNLPVRNNFGDKRQYPEHKMVDYFEYHPEIILNSSDIIKEKYKEYDTIEIMCHPAYIDKFLRDHSSFTLPRIEELDFLTSDHASNLFSESNGITLINYSEL